MRTIWPKQAWSERSPDLMANDRYIILIRTKHFTERHFCDKAGWLKVSARGLTFLMTAEQVLNHVLPAVAGH